MEDTIQLIIMFLVIFTMLVIGIAILYGIRYWLFVLPEKKVNQKLFENKKEVKQ